MINSRTDIPTLSTMTSKLFLNQFEPLKTLKLNPVELHYIAYNACYIRYVQRRRAFEDREKEKIADQKKFEENLIDRNVRVRILIK